MTLATRSRILSALSKLDPAKPWDIAVRPHVRKRSDSQNARYWKLTGMAAEVVGCSPEELHEEMLCQFFGVKECKIGDVPFMVPRERSKAQNTKRFAEYMTFCEEKYVAYLGVWLE